MQQIQQNDSVYLASKVRPSLRQLEWQKLEFYAFCHFGTNTFTDKEWGDGNASPSVFNPTDFDADQWVREIKNAGMKALILTCKHHDGFCLWPSQYTDYSVKNSPCKKDIVKEVSSACREHDIKFGVYLSPWDRHEETYGQGKAYDRYFTNQLKELGTNYGDIFCFWFDGACGEGKNGRKQEYDWDLYISTVREIQPGAVISICGPDVRWCGNEAGKYRDSEWSVLPSGTASQAHTAELSQQTDDDSFRVRDAKEKDLGSREAINGCTDFIWYPCETDVSIRPGWFYHENEDRKVKSVKELMKIYMGTVGGNSALLLNIPPDRRGQLSGADVIVLRELGAKLRAEFTEIQIDEIIPDNFTSEDNTYVCEGENRNPSLTLKFSKPVYIDKISLSEDIANGQHIEEFEIYEVKGEKCRQIANATTIGAKRICRIKKKKYDCIKIVFSSYRYKAIIKEVHVYMKKDLR